MLKTKKDIKEYITKELQKEQEFYNSHKDDANIQVIKMCSESKGKIEAYEDLLFYFKH